MTHSHLILTIFFLATFGLLPAAKSDSSSGSTQWRALPNVQTALGVTNYAWDGDSICFSNDQNLIRFYQGRRKFDVNGTAVWLNAPPDGSVTEGNWRLTATDLDLLLLSVLPKAEGALKPVRVMLDPGHGGEDDGASSKGPAVKEKDLTLAVALRLGSHLTAAGLQVVYTRTNDVALSLDERSRLARRCKADLFVSIHANYALNSDAAGVETYALTPCGYQGTAEGSRVPGWQIGNRFDFHNTLLGFSIHSKLAGLVKTPDRGLRRQSFSVLRESSCPAVLIEIGFLSNQAEALTMLDDAWQDKCATAVTEGILAYAKKVDGLDKAVAEKHARDTETNERWRRRLAARAGKSAAPSPTNGAAAARTILATVRPATNATADAKSNLAAATTLPTNSAVSMHTRLAAATSLSTNSAVSAHTHLAASSLFNTNTAPVALSALIDFYAAGKAE